MWNFSTIHVYKFSAQTKNPLILKPYKQTFDQKGRQ